MNSGFRQKKEKERRKGRYWKQKKDKKKDKRKKKGKVLKTETIIWANAWRLDSFS